MLHYNIFSGCYESTIYFFLISYIIVLFPQYIFEYPDFAPLFIKYFGKGEFSQPLGAGLHQDRARTEFQASWNYPHVSGSLMWVSIACFSPQWME